MTGLRETLQAEFTNGEVLQRPGRGGGPAQDYIEDETVMDRLDDALGVGNWSILVEPISLADGVVKVRLGIDISDNEWVWYEDFGYANNPQNDGLKEAVTDGIRRCGRMPGVARYLYHKHTSVGASSPARSSGNGRAVSPPPARPPARTSTDVPDDPYADLPPEWDAGAVNAGAASTGRPSGSGWSFKELAAAAEGKGIAKNTIYQTADQLFGKGKKVTELSPAQREQIAFEMGLVG